jgi:hypothetical protein
MEQPALPAQAQVQTLVGVLPAPAAPPEALPAELPPVPERFMEPIGPFTMYMEVLASASPSENGLLASPGCVSDSVYKRGMKLVYRFEVYDMDNNVRVTSADGSTAHAVLPDGQVLPAYFLSGASRRIRSCAGHAQLDPPFRGRVQPDGSRGC